MDRQRGAKRASRVLVSWALLTLSAPLPLRPSAPPREPPRRPFTPSDALRIREVTEPALSPDGEWVAYVVRSADTLRDEREGDLWMVRWDGSRSVQLTHTTDESERAPRWSPDGRWLAFLSSRGDSNDVSQLWLMDRAGGEAERITSTPGGVNDYAWAPDGARLVLVVRDAEPADSVTAGGDTAKKHPKPIVVDRFFFKQDIEGYLGSRRDHLWLLDLQSHALAQLTRGAVDDVLPAWAPDGRTIAFVSKRAPDPDRSEDWNL
jgi:Tol biopolymer transport system component